MVVPSVVLVEDDCSSKTSCWVDSSSSDGDGCQVDQEHSESDWERCKNLSNSKEKQLSILILIQHNTTKVLSLFLYNLQEHESHERFS